MRNRYWTCVMYSYTPILFIALLCGVFVYSGPACKITEKSITSCRRSGQNYYTSPIFKKYELLTLRNLYIYCGQIFLYEHHQETLPGVFSHFVELNNIVHEHYTRHEKRFHVSPCKSLQKLKCLKCSDVKWKNYMIEHMNYNCSCLVWICSEKAFIKTWYSCSQYCDFISHYDCATSIVLRQMQLSNVYFVSAEMYAMILLIDWTSLFCHFWQVQTCNKTVMRYKYIHTSRTYR